MCACACIQIHSRKYTHTLKECAVPIMEAFILIVGRLRIPSSSSPCAPLPPLCLVIGVHLFGTTFLSLWLSPQLHRRMPWGAVRTRPEPYPRPVWTASLEGRGFLLCPRGTPHVWEQQAWQLSESECVGSHRTRVSNSSDEET